MGPLPGGEASMKISGTDMDDGRARWLLHWSKPLVAGPPAMMLFATLGLLRANLEGKTVPNAGAAAYLVRNAGAGLLLGGILALTTYALHPRTSGAPAFITVGALLLLFRPLQLTSAGPLDLREVVMFLAWISGLLAFTVCHAWMGWRSRLRDPPSHPDLRNTVCAENP